MTEEDEVMIEAPDDSEELNDYDIIRQEELLPLASITSTDGESPKQKLAQTIEAKRVEHNQKCFESLKPGDLIEYKRNLYSHWAVYIGNDKIVHLYGEKESASNFSISGVIPVSGTSNTASVVISSFWDIVNGSFVYRNNSLDDEFKPLPVEQILARAFSRVDETNYSLFWYNCEHFAKSCRYGVDSCMQTDGLMKLLKLGYTVTKGLRSFEYNCKKLIDKI